MPNYQLWPAAFVGAIGSILAIIALTVNDLSGYTQLGINETCEWKRVCGGELPFCINYADCVYYFGIDCSATESAGSAYLALTIITVFLSAFTTAILMVERLRGLRKYALYLFAGCAVLCLIAACVWIGTGTDGLGCYDTKYTNTYLGASIILLWIDMVIFLVACYVTRRQMKNTKIQQDDYDQI